MLKGTVVIDQSRCKGCNLCVQFCPQEVLVLDQERLNAKGYHPAKLAETTEASCTGCAVCSVVCPDVCFTVYRESKSNAKHLQQAEGAR